MADFMTNLWESVFTAGPTPTLLVATNATFVALQLLLGALLIATYSIHFAILSVLCAGLWYSINWFAAELRTAQAEEEESERLRKRTKSNDRDWKTRGEVGDSADDEGEDTEVEDPGMRESAASISREPAKEEEKVRDDAADGVIANQSEMATTGVAALGLEAAAEKASEIRRRRVEETDRSGEVSTDSEWEKVDEHR